MKICDRCTATAVDMITFEMDDQRYDLCASCRQVVLETVTNKPTPEPIDHTEKPSSRKRKNG